MCIRDRYWMVIMPLYLRLVQCLDMFKFIWNVFLNTTYSKVVSLLIIFNLSDMIIISFFITKYDAGNNVHKFNHMCGTIRKTKTNARKHTWRSTSWWHSTNFYMGLRIDLKQNPRSVVFKRTKWGFSGISYSTRSKILEEMQIFLGN